MIVHGEAGGGSAASPTRSPTSSDRPVGSVLRASTRIQAETPLGLVAAALGPLLEGPRPAPRHDGRGRGPPRRRRRRPARLRAGPRRGARRRRAPSARSSSSSTTSTPPTPARSRSSATSPRVTARPAGAVAPHRHAGAGGVRRRPSAPPTCSRCGSSPSRRSRSARCSMPSCPGALTPAQRDRLAQLAEGNPQFADGDRPRPRRRGRRRGGRPGPVGRRRRRRPRRPPRFGRRAGRGPDRPAADAGPHHAAGRRR